ncbi:MAG: carboxypeptidase-like regulatory domain-containing protein [Balneola sp.]
MTKPIFSLTILLLIPYSVISQTSISGHIVDIQLGEPIAGATVFIHDEFNIALNPALRTTTNEFGYYEFNDMEPGKYSINAFVYYEAYGDTFAYVYQPGMVTLEDEYPEAFGDSYLIDFGFSKFYFNYLVNNQNPNNPIYPESMGYGPGSNTGMHTLLRFLKHRVYLKNSFNFERNETVFLEKKTW